MLAVVDITERKIIENTLYFLTQESWAEQADQYFHSMVRYIAQTLNLDYVLIDRVEDGETARTLGNYWLGKSRPNFEYPLKDTPCSSILGNQVCTYTGNLQEQFPKDVELVNMGAVYYSGVPLWNSHHQPTGLIAVLNRQPVENISLVEAILQIVANHVGHEIERQEAEAQLKAQLDELRRWHDATIGREERIIGLKREVNELLLKAGKQPRYRSTNRIK